MVALGATHCGSGCVLADIVGAWVVDYFLALAFGIVFQYFTVAPMRNLSLGEGMAAAAKANFFSLAAWQVGMYGWMAIATFLIFGNEIEKTSPVSGS